VLEFARTIYPNTDRNRSGYVITVLSGVANIEHSGVKLAK